MAFNFNWSPLAADASFYTRAQELLTAAINKSPKPPIIVDDIIVNELNLGSVPPDLEILEIGDLAEDRFRGIFKMCYTGDAFITLKTRVQANPLNTYLSTKPYFASPQPLAAASGLTIPLQITLSDIKLSAIIILVFSNQKGLTLVFRNDPLESLKVSSTFDSIPFVREYLQKEIEGQLRTLLMDEVPAIIHRLSLRLWVPEHRAREDEEQGQKNLNTSAQEKAIDPLATPPQDPVDLSGHILDASQIASLSSDSGLETRSLFSQKNLLRLRALTDSHKTLSLFTPSIRDAVFRAWVGPNERGEPRSNPHAVHAMPTLSRAHSYDGSATTTYVFSDNGEGGSHTTRPTLSSFGSAVTGLSLSSNRHGKAHGGRKRKHRIVNLRKPGAPNTEMDSTSGEGSTISSAISSAASNFGHPQETAEQREGELVTPPPSPEKPRVQADVQTPSRMQSSSLYDTARLENHQLTPKPSTPVFLGQESSCPSALKSRMQFNTQSEDFLQSSSPFTVQQQETPFSSLSSSQTTYPPPSLPLQSTYPASSTNGVPEQAWMMKIAGEIARRVHDQKVANSGFWEGNDQDEAPPPAYSS